MGRVAVSPAMDMRVGRMYSIRRRPFFLHLESVSVDEIGAKHVGSQPTLPIRRRSLCAWLAAVRYCSYTSCGFSPTRRCASVVEAVAIDFAAASAPTSCTYLTPHLPSLP